MPEAEKLRTKPPVGISVFSLFLFAVVKCPDQEQLRKDRVYLAYNSPKQSVIVRKSRQALKELVPPEGGSVPVRPSGWQVGFYSANGLVNGQTVPHRHGSTGQSAADNSQLTFSSQIIVSS